MVVSCEEASVGLLRLRLYVLLFVILPLAAMSPFLAARFANMFDKPFTVHERRADGGVRTLTFDRRIKPPEWLELPEGAIVTAADRSVESTMPVAAGSMEFTASQSFPALKAFYTESLSRHGFSVTDERLGPLDAKSAKILGIYGTISARRSNDHLQVLIRFNEEEGLVQTARTVEIGWHVSK
jgi:hypothetical protein